MAIEISALVETWNSAGTTKYGVKYDVTDTASAAASKLLELMVSSSSKFGVRKDGRVNFASGTLFDSSGDGGGAFKTSAASSLLSWDTSGNTTLAGTLGCGAITSSGNVTAGASSAFKFSGGTQLTANGDGGAYIKNNAGTTTFTFASDGSFSTGGTITGTGVTSSTTLGAKSVTLSTGTITTSQPAIDGTQTWNAVGVTFAADKINVTNTASASGSTLIDRQVGGTSMFKVDKDGALTLNSGSASESLTITTASGGSEAKLTAARKLYLKATGGYNAIVETSGAFQLYSGSASAFMYADANYILALRSGANAQTFRSYYTYTDASNYQRLGLNTAAASVELAAESAGTGAANIDVKLTPKGTAYVQFGTHTGTSDTAVSGYITIKDSGGTTRKLAVIT